MPSTNASTTIRWCSTNGSRCRPRRSGRIPSTGSNARAASRFHALTNPNRLRSLAGTFGANHWAFHYRTGRGYAFLADMVLAADKLNPQVAARLITPFGRWRRFERERAPR